MFEYEYEYKWLVINSEIIQTFKELGEKGWAWAGNEWGYSIFARLKIYNDGKLVTIQK